jgi:hypothetical protein
MFYYFTIISNSDILIETSSTTETNYRIIQLICDEIKQKRTRGLYATKYNIHYLYDVYDDYYFILICYDTVVLRLAMSLLERIRKDFFMRFVIQQEKLHRKNYSNWCRQEIEFYLTHPEADKLRGLIVEVEEITKIMNENLKKAVERNIKLEDLYNGTKALEADANLFNSNAKKLKRHECLRYYCCCLASCCSWCI